MDVQKYVDGRFGKTGRLVPLGDDPLSSFNLLLGKIVLTLWEMVDSFNLLSLPRDPKSPLSGQWCLLDFVPKKVSSSNTSKRTLYRAYWHREVHEFSCTIAHFFRLLLLL